MFIEKESKFPGSNLYNFISITSSSIDDIFPALEFIWSITSDIQFSFIREKVAKRSENISFWLEVEFLQNLFQDCKEFNITCIKK